MAQTKNLTSENATQLLNCSHAIGRSTRFYTMRCHILKEMSDGRRFKILVFGERNWRHREHISRVRYVDKYKVHKRHGV